MLLLLLQNCKCVDLRMSAKPAAASQGRETQRSLVFNAKHWPRKRASDLRASQLSLQQLLLTQISRSTLADQRYERQFYVGGEKMYFSFISFRLFTYFLDTLKKKKRKAAFICYFFQSCPFFPPLISRSRLHRLRRRMCCWGCFGRHRRPQQIVWKEEGRFWRRKKVWFPTLPFC